MISKRAGAWTIVAILVTAASWTLSGQSAPVTSDRLLKADQEPGNWLMYSGIVQRMAIQPAESDHVAEREKPAREMALSGTPSSRSSKRRRSWSTASCT